MIRLSIIHYSDKLIQKFPMVYEQIQKSLWESFVWYIINSKYRKSVELKKWIKEQIDNPEPRVEQVANRIKTVDDLDKQVVNVLRFVRQNIQYKGDLQSWDIQERWNEGWETVKDGYGDCEDHHILMYLLCRLKGVPANRLYICAGDVKSGSGSATGGHCWLAYKPKNYPLNFTFLDSCYYYKGNEVPNRNLFTINNQNIFEYVKTKGGWTELKSKYYKIWFAFNEEKAFSRVKHK